MSKVIINKTVYLRFQQQLGLVINWLKAIYKVVIHKNTKNRDN
jgi:hypothetical protein